jgi:hypothetical protein
LVDVTQSAIVHEESLVNLSQAFENRGISGQVLSHFDEGAEDVHAHGNGSRAVKNGGSHQSAVFGPFLSSISMTCQICENRITMALNTC